MPFIGRLRAGYPAVAAVALAYSVFTLAVRHFPLPNIALLIVAVGSPYTPLVALVGLAAAARVRRVALSIATAVILATSVAVQVPWYWLGRAADVGPHTDLRVLSSNLRKGRADATYFVAFASANADVISVSELTPGVAARFAQTGIEQSFPYSSLRPGRGASGVGIYSRYPLVTAGPTIDYPGILAAELDLPGVRVPPLVAAVHITSPLAFHRDSFGAWERGIMEMRDALRALALDAGPGTVVTAGDFNSTPDMRQFRDLLAHGYRDAAHQARSGYAPTFPALSRLPPLITIDHVLTRNAVATSVRTVDIPGSDHRALLASIGVPVDAPAS